MALNIKDEKTEALVNELASLTGETKTGAVREAVRERLDRAKLRAGVGTGGGKEGKPESLREFLEREIWPLFPPEMLGRDPMTKAEREEILGYGPEGY